MTNEKIIEKLYLAGKQIKDFDIAMSIIRKNDGIPKISGVFSEPDVVIAELIYRLEKENKEKIMKKAGKTDVLNVAKSILKDSKRIHEHKPQIHTAFMCDEKQCFTDGFRALMLSGEKILDVQTNPEKVFSIDVACKVQKDNNAVLPDLAEFKTVLARFKNLYVKEKGICRFYDKDNNIIIGFNPDFLLDAIKATAANKFYYSKGNKPALFETDNIKMVVMPVYVKEPTTKGEHHYIDVFADGSMDISTVTVE